MPAQADGLSAYRRGAGRFGRAPDYHRQVGSTNDLALQAGRRGVPEGHVVVAEEQTSGRGRLARRWRAPPGSSLLISILFRPPDPFPYYAPRTTMLCGLALLSAVRSVTGVAARLKWPNDLIVEDAGRSVGWHKLAGMLSELGADAGIHGDQPGWLVVGIGLNVNISADILPRIAPNATSLQVLTGRSVDRVALLDRLLAGVESRYEALLAGTDPLPAWQDALAWMGEIVEVSTPQGSVTGLAIGVDDRGALEVRGPGGEVKRFSTGDVSLRPAPPP